MENALLHARVKKHFFFCNAAKKHMMEHKICSWSNGRE